jgi:signal transduction histidine kinase
MASMNKLLNKTLLYYAVSALFLMLVSAPFYYLLSEKLYLDDVDEAILLRKNEFFASPLKTLKQSEIPTWNGFNRDIWILPDTVDQQKGSIVQQVFYDSLANEWEPYRVLYSNITIGNSNYLLMIRLNLVESEDLLGTTILLYGLAMSAMLLGFVLVSRIVSARIWRPFYQTLGQIERFSIESHKIPEFAETKTLEFQQLNQSVELLIDQNLKAYQIQKEFTENASHELQTPLAVFSSKLDLLLQDPSLTDVQSIIVGQLYSSISRLSRLNKNLLLLARIEKGNQMAKEHCNVNELIENTLLTFSELAKEKTIQVHTDLEVNVTVHANRDLLEVLLNNLLINAVTHNQPNGRVSIQTAPDQLLVSNSGLEYPLDAASIFKRFFKTESGMKGSGLGLAIVEKIAAVHGWSVTYAFEEKKHVFRVQF